MSVPTLVRVRRADRRGRHALFVAEHPEFESRRHRSRFAAQYGAFDSGADLLRQIGHDERMHKQESEAYLAADPLWGD